MPNVERQTRYITVDVQIVNEKEFPIILVSILLTIRKKKKKQRRIQTLLICLPFILSINPCMFRSVSSAISI